MRPYRDWSAGTDLERRWFREEDKYLKTYATYAQQVCFVTRQLADFVDALRTAGQYDSTTIILHGDHGPRLRLVFPEREDPTAGLPSRECHPVNRYHYTSDPDTQDLLNTFATLFAIKPAGAHRPETVNDRGSVTYFLWTEFFPKVVQGAGPELNSVYLFDKDRRPIAIPLTKLW